VRLIVGLGNPGPDYVGTRHNLGFSVLERVASARRMPLSLLPGYAGRFARRDDVALLLPHTYMNRSGSSVGPALAELGVALEDLLVVHDELDLPFGRARLRRGGGPGGHRGVASIQEVVGGEGFHRLKLGVGKPEDGDTIDWVLAPFSEAEARGLPELIDYAVAFVQAFIDEGPGPAMTRFNRKRAVIEVEAPPSQDG
jgi:peptidyl-tRNA hydrolase, PTH1 family